MVRLTSEEARQLAYTTILAQISEGVIVTDVVGTIVFVNDAAAAIHGVARLDVRPNAYSDTYHLYREDGRPYPSEELPLARAVRGDTVKDARWLIRRPDNQEVLAEGTARPLTAANGRRVGAVLTLRDVTTQYAAERFLRGDTTRDVRRAANTQQTGPLGGNAKAVADDASEKIKASLQDIVTQARQAREAPSLNDARQHAEHIQATAAALLSLVDTLLGCAASEPRSVVSDNRFVPRSVKG